MASLAVLQFVLAVIDTNVVTSALITRDQDSPTSRILRSMAIGGFHFVLSELPSTHQCYTAAGSFSRPRFAPMMLIR